MFNSNIAFELTKNLSLNPIDSDQIENLGSQIWSRLHEEISTDSPRLYFSSLNLKMRWQKGCSAIVINQNKIIAHISLIPLISPNKKILFQKIFSCPESLLENIWESATGWTDPKFRRKGIQYKIRQKLYEQISQDSLIVAHCIGIGASPILSKLGWHLVNWDEYRFIRLLLGEIKNKKFYHHSGNIIPIENLKFFLGYGSFPNSIPSHNWENYIHLWINNISKAKFIESSISLKIGLWTK